MVRRVKLHSLVVLAGCAALPLLACGCGETEKALLIQDPAQFQTVAVEASKPALVMFFKGGCASCAALEPTMDQLASEYKGRAVVGKFMILTFVFGITSPELKDRYGVVFVPHVVLLVNGQERGHWIMDYNIDTYRKALNEVLAKLGPASAPAPKKL